MYDFILLVYKRLYQLSVYSLIDIFISLMKFFPTKIVVPALILGLIFTFLVSTLLTGESARTGLFFYIIGWMLIVYGVIGCLYKIGICLECYRQNQQPQPQQPPPFLRQPDHFYSYDIVNAHVYRPPHQIHNNNIQPINPSDLAYQYHQQIRQSDGQYRQSYNQSLCTVCLESFQPNELVTRLQCGHKFHQACIIDWAQKQKNCPVCRIPIK